MMRGEPFYDMLRSGGRKELDVHVEGVGGEAACAELFQQAGCRLLALRRQGTDAFAFAPEDEEVLVFVDVQECAAKAAREMSGEVTMASAVITE